MSRERPFLLDAAHRTTLGLEPWGGSPAILDREFVLVKLPIGEKKGVLELKG
jgi:hypothetical protein